MLILFSGTEESNLFRLYIKDTQTTLNTPVAGLEGWDSDFLQSQTLCNTPMFFSAEEINKSAGTSAAYTNVKRKSKVLFKINFSNMGANTVIRPKYVDSAGIITVGSAITITAIAEQEGTKYMSPLTVLDTYGAKLMTFKIESISAGTIDIRTAGV